MRTWRLLISRGIRRRSFARDGTPSAPEAAAWHAYRDDRAFLDLRAPPQAGKNLLAGMFELHEEVIARRRAAGTQYWYVNVGLASPPVPPAAGAGWQKYLPAR